MDNATIIAQIIGPVFLVIGAGMLARNRFVSSVLQNAAQNPGTLYTMGILALLIGAVMTAFQEVWSGWELLVTLIGWIALLKGITILLFPESVAALYRKVSASRVLVIGGMVVMIMGCLLVWLGFGW